MGEVICGNRIKKEYFVDFVIFCGQMKIQWDIGDLCLQSVCELLEVKNGEWKMVGLVNKVIFVGNVGQDLEVRQFQNGG